MVLDKTEAYHALKALMPVDKDGKWLSDNFSQLWKMWDINGDNVVNMYEFQAPRGLLQFVWSSCPSKGMQRAAWELPDFRIESQKLKWFRYWDEDFSGSLDINEVTRAMVKSFNIEMSPGSIAKVRRMLSEVWYNFDFDGDGTISEHEFVMRGGLWEMLMEQGAGHISTAERNAMAEEGLRRGPDHSCPHCQEHMPGYVPPTTRSFQLYYKNMDTSNPQSMQAPPPPRRAPPIKEELQARWDNRTCSIGMLGHEVEVHESQGLAVEEHSVHLCARNASRAYNRRKEGPRGFHDYRTPARKDWHESFDRYVSLPAIKGR